MIAPTPSLDPLAAEGAPAAGDTADVPAPRPGRIPVIDTVRGFALLGVCLVNYTMFAQPLFESDLGGRPTNGAWDWWLERGMYLLAEGKFYPLFSLLFGLGLFLQSERAPADGTSVGGRFARRLTVLVGLGLVHGFLIWVGDILLTYALLGFPLLMFRRASPRWLAVWAGVAVSLLLGLAVAGGVFFHHVRSDPEKSAELARRMEEGKAKQAELKAQAYAAYQGGYGEVVRFRAKEFPGQLARGLVFVGPLIFAMFLTGLWVGRKGLLHAPEEHRAFLRRAFALCGTLGLAASVASLALHAPGRSGPPSPKDLAAIMLHLLGGAVLAYGYMCGLVLLLLRADWARRLAPLTAVGRMSLTNYLTQTLVGGLVFYGYGLGLFGRAGVGLCLAVALTLYGAQVAFSNWWMARFRMGPAEWLWRSLTLWERQPLRRRAAA